MQDPLGARLHNSPLLQNKYFSEEGCFDKNAPDES